MRSTLGRRIHQRRRIDLEHPGQLGDGRQARIAARLEGARVVSDVDREGAPDRDMPTRAQLPAPARALPSVPPDCPDELVEKMGADILAKCERRWPRRAHALGPCLVWTGPTVSNAGKYGWMYDAARKSMDVSHRVVWRRCFGPIPRGPNGKTLEVDHICKVTLCQRPDHLQLLTKPHNLKRRGPTRGVR